MDAVAARGGAYDKDGVTFAGSDGAGHFAAVENTDGHGIDKGILVVGRIEIDLAADGGHTEAIAIIGNAADDSAQKFAVARHGERAETQRIERGDGTRAHGEDITQNAANTGGRALVRFDGRGVIVALDFEADGKVVADVEHAGVFLARFDEGAADSFSAGV